MKTIFEPAKPYFKLLGNQKAQAVFEQCPTDLPELISHWFLVPEEHDDCKLSQQLTNVACFKEKGTMVGAFCRQCAKYPDCQFLLSCPNFKECYPEMPWMYEHQLREEMKLMYKAYLEKGAEA